MSILLSKIAPKPLVTDDEGRTLTGSQYTFTEPPIMDKAMVLRPRSTPPTDALSQQEGSIYYDSDDKIYYFYDGTTWTSLVAAVGGTPIYSPSIDNRVARFDGVGGNIQDSTVAIGDTGNMTGVGSLTASGQGSFASVATDAISAPSGTVSFSGDHVDSINIMDATTARVTTLQTDAITTTAASIDCNNKSFSNVNTVTAATLQATTGTINGLNQVQSINGPATISITSGAAINIEATTEINLAGVTNADELNVNVLDVAGAFTSNSISAPTVTGTTSVTSPTVNASTEVVTPQVRSTASLDLEATNDVNVTAGGTLAITAPATTVSGTSTFTGIMTAGTVVATQVFGTLKQKFGTSGVGYEPSGRLYKLGAVFGSTAAGGTQTVFSFVIPAGACAAYGDGIRLYVAGRTGSSANAKSLRLTVNGTNFNSNALTTGVARSLVLIATITRTSIATQFNIHYQYFEGDAINKGDYGELQAALDFDVSSNTVTLSSLTGTTVNDIIIRQAYAELI